MEQTECRREVQFLIALSYNYLVKMKVKHKSLLIRQNISIRIILLRVKQRPFRWVYQGNVQ